MHKAKFILYISILYIIYIESCFHVQMRFLYKFLFIIWICVPKSDSNYKLLN